MLFNSINFLLFLPVVFVLYWFVTNRVLLLQNLLLLVASYYFYASWDPRFLGLLMFSTLLDYLSGLKMTALNGHPSRKFWFWLSISLNLGFLGVFKYYNFFAGSFAEAMNNMGVEVNPLMINVVLPVGISFYTFHGLSYIIDVYRGQIQAERNYIDYALFVSFFPLLVAGPIARANHLLPQFKVKRSFDSAQAVDGLKQILWGLFKKMVIADQCAVFVNLIFNQPELHSGSTLVLGLVLFSFQVYGDFSGYSDIAVGTARLFGISLNRNFAFPYFSRNILEFWRKWHISLTQWFKDYIYIPLGGNRLGKWVLARNVFIIFLLSAFWHGANWTFIVWGILHAIYVIGYIVLKKPKNDATDDSDNYPKLHQIGSIALTFSLVTFSWVFFRAQTLTQSFVYLKGIFSASLFTTPYSIPKPIVLSIMLFMIIGWIGRKQQYAIAAIGANWPKVYRWSLYYVLVLFVFNFISSKQDFIYFQF